MSRPLKLYLLLIGVHLGQLAWYAPRLPATVASHFDAAGNPDGWMPRGPFLGLLGGLSLFYLALFLGIAAIVRRTPVRLVSLPNREYWLAPERADATRRILADEMFKIAAATQALMIVVTQLAIEVGLGRRTTLSDAFWIALVAYFAVLIWWLIALLRRFRLPKQAAVAGEDGRRIEPT